MFMECTAGCSWNGWPDAVECAATDRKEPIQDCSEHRVMKLEHFSRVYPS